MVWNIRIRDIIGFSKDPYRYEVTDIGGNNVLLKNCLTHEIRDVKLSRIIKEIKILRRKD